MVNGQIWRARLRRVGAITLPIGKPWFKLLDLGAGRRMLWPVQWQGWLAVVSFWIWVFGSSALFLSWGWQPNDSMLYGWFLPSAAVALLVVGIKTDMRRD